MTAFRTRPLRRFIITTLIISLFLTACATSDDAKVVTGKRGKIVDRICFTQNITSFSANTPKSVIVEISANKTYLIETLGGCTQLRNAQRIGFSSNSSCVTRGDRIIVSDSFFKERSGVGPDRCAISRIYTWEETDNNNETQDTE